MAEAPQILINDAVRRQVLLEGIKVNQANKFEPFLRDLEKQIRNRVTDEGVTVRNRTRLNVLLTDIRRIEKEIFEEYTGQLVLDLDELAITEGSIETGSLTRAIEDFEAVLPAPEQLIAAYKNNPLSVRGKSQGLTLTPFLREYTNDQTLLIEGAIRQGFSEGQTTGEIVRRLRGTRSNRFQDGLLAGVNKNTNIMVRTAVQNASSSAKQRIWESNSDVVVGVQWVSTLDSSTTTECRSLDGEVFPVDSGPRPPIHYGCRSTTAPALSDRFAFLKRGSRRPAKGQKGGRQDITQVDQSTTYYSWLKNQPASFQDKVLGPTRGKLFRNGGLSAEKFADLQLNRNFRPMTIEEMAAEAPEAFREANLLDDEGNVKIARK